MKAEVPFAAGQQSDFVLQVRDLSVGYKTRQGNVSAVRDVTFDIRRGETFGIVGESGSGKSTLAFTVMGYLGSNGRVAGGRILYQGRDLLGLNRGELDRLRGSKISMVYQDPMTALNPSLRVGDQVAEALRVHERLSKRDAINRTVELFEAVNMPQPTSIIQRYPHQISGGQQQRVLIALALSCNPDLLIMDEPTTGLDVTTEAQILDLVESLKRHFSSAIMFISHNLGVIARVSDTVGVMYASQMVEQGSVGEVFRHQLHPYTSGLLGCLPKLGFGRKSRSLQVIPGIIPDLSHPPAACSFEPRCPYSQEKCRCESPEMVEVAPNHRSRCFFWKEQEAAREPIDVPAGEPGEQRATTEVAVPAPEGLLEVSELTKHYVESSRLLGIFGLETVVHAVERVSVTLRPGETLAVVGESGCGKTTLARCVVGLIEPTAGEVRFAGRKLPGSVGRRSRNDRRRLQMVFQNPDSTLNPRRSIGEALMRPLELFRGLRGKEAYDAAVELLRAVRLDQRYIDRLPSQLSGGEKQRIGIARAFATNPDLIVCDEPVSALDVSVQAAILNLLADLQSRHGTSYLFISHDLSAVRYLADRVAVIYLGKLCEIGPVERIFAPPYHPYTEALLSAVPIPDPVARPTRIRLHGPVPSAANPPSGCPFQTRCPRKIGQICEQVAPPEQVNADDHVIACHIPLSELAATQGEG